MIDVAHWRRRLVEIEPVVGEPNVDIIRRLCTAMIDLMEEVVNHEAERQVAAFAEPKERNAMTVAEWNALERARRNG